MIVAGIQKAKPFTKKHLPSAQMSYMGQTKDIPQMTPYGFFSMPPVNSLWCIFPFRDGDDDLFGFGNDYKNGPSGLVEHDVCLYNTKTKAKFILKADGDIDVYGPKDININADKNINLNAGENINFNSKEFIVKASVKTTIETLAITIDATVGVIDCTNLSWTGSVVHGGGLFISNQVGVSSHKHGGVLAGPSDTNSPNVPS